MCFGILLYCSRSVKNTIENLESYQKKDFDALVKELQWFYDGEREASEHHLGHLDDFSRAWREEQIANLEMFKQYHREFVRLAGSLKKTGQIEDRAYNKWFWMGLHPSTRESLEKRMKEDDPTLDIRTPFPTSTIAKAAEHIFDRNRFDKDLLEEERTLPRGSPEGIAAHRQRREKIRATMEETDSEDDKPTSRWTPSKAPEKPRNTITARRSSESKEKPPVDDITELVKGLERLNVNDSEYRAYYTRLNFLSPASCRWYPEPAVSPPPNPVQRVRFAPTERPRRELPPHLAPPIDSKFGERRDVTCFGCSATGHRIDQCEKIETYVTKGQVQRVAGRLRWPDGSTISRRLDENWMNAIQRQVPSDVKANDGDKNSREKGVYYVKIPRADSDADTDDQECFGWESVTGPVNHMHAFGVDRPQRVSRETRKGVQTNVPAGSHRVGDFPLRRNENGAKREKFPIADNTHIHTGQHRTRTPTPPTPIDVTPKKFKGEGDDEFVPMDVEETVPDKRVDHEGKMSTRHGKGDVRNVGNVGSRKNKAQRQIIDKLLDWDCTIKLQDLLLLSPSARRDVGRALRAMNDDLPEEPDKIRFEEPKAEASKNVAGGKEVMRVDVGGGKHEWVQMDKAQERRRMGLLEIGATIGGAKMVGVVDSGSSENIISEEMAEATGLPIIPLEEDSFPVNGVSGPPVRCKYWIPNAEIYVTEKKLLTKGDLFIVEGIKVDLLYGRPWMVRNRSSIQERDRGTYVSWFSDNVPYELNVTKSKAGWWLKDRKGEVEFCKTENEERIDREMTSLVAKRARDHATDRSCVSDSEASNETLSFEYLPDESPAKLQRARENETRKCRRNEWEESNLEEVAVEGDVDEVEQPSTWMKRRKPRVTEKFRKSVTASTNGDPGRNVIKIDRDMEEEVTRLLQEDVGEEDWKAFTSREQKRMARKDKQWLAWIERESDEDLPTGEKGPRSRKRLRTSSAQSPDEPFLDPLSTTPELSKIPATHLRESTNQTKDTKPPEPRFASTEVTARRSQRFRRLTEKGLYGEEMKEKGRRTYRQEDKISRVVRKRALPPSQDEYPLEDDDSQVFTFCLQIARKDTERKGLTAKPPEMGRTVEEDREGKGGEDDLCHHREDHGPLQKDKTWS